MSPKTPTVLFVEDHKLLRHALASFLAKETGMQTLEASNGQEALEQLKGNNIDLMILDVEMPVMNGHDAFIEAKKKFPGLKVIVFTYLTGVDNLLFFIHHGADGFIHKGDDKEFMLEAIQHVLKGEQYFPHHVIAQINPRLKAISISNKKKLQLSVRELQLINSLKDGMTSKEISAETGLSPKTIDTYRERLMNKVQVENTVALVSFAIKNGLIRV